MLDAHQPWGHESARAPPRWVGHVRPVVAEGQTQPPLSGEWSAENTTALPTDARLRQKAKLKKDKEAGIKPKKKKFAIEPGNDDCGEDLAGLGTDVALLSQDVIQENMNEDSDEDGHFVHTNTFTHDRNQHKCV